MRGTARHALVKQSRINRKPPRLAARLLDAGGGEEGDGGRKAKGLCPLDPRWGLRPPQTP